MTVQTTVNKIVHSGDGVQTDFTYNFIVLDENHMEVYVDQTLQVSGYTVSGIDNPSGGTVSFSSAPANGTQVTLLRVVPLTQLISYTDYDPFAANTHESGLDAHVMISQQLQEQIDRALSADIGTDPTVDYTFPDYSAGKALMWTESDPKGLQNSTDDFNDIVTNATTQATNAAASASAAATSASNASTSETNASTSASNASTSETNAATHEAKAQDWAEELEDVEVETGKYSALHWAAKSEDYAQDSEATLSISTGTISWDWSSQGQLATVSLTENATLSMISDFAGFNAGVLRVVQDATGGRTLSYNSGYDAGSVGTVDIASDASATTILAFYRVSDTDVKFWETWRSA